MYDLKKETNYSKAKTDAFSAIPHRIAEVPYGIQEKQIELGLFHMELGQF